MSAELVERLRHRADAGWSDSVAGADELMHQAADEIERLRELVGEFAAVCPGLPKDTARIAEWDDWDRTDTAERMHLERLADEAENQGLMREAAAEAER